MGEGQRSRAGMGSVLLGALSLVAVIVSVVAYVHYDNNRSYNEDFLGGDFVIQALASLVALVMAFAGLVLGVVRRSQEGNKGGLPLAGIVICAVLLLANVWLWRYVYRG